MLTLRLCRDLKKWDPEKVLGLLVVATLELVMFDHSLVKELIKIPRLMELCNKLASCMYKGRKSSLDNCKSAIDRIVLGGGKYVDMCDWAGNMPSTFSPGGQAC